MSIGRLRGPLYLAVVLLLAGVQARAAAERDSSSGVQEPPAATIGVRTGDHQGYGRIVFDLPKGMTVQSVSEGSRVLLVFAGAARVAQPTVLPRNLVGLQVGDGTVTLTLAPGSRARPQRLGDRLAFDLLDPVGRPSGEAGRPVNPAPIKVSHSMPPDAVEEAISEPAQGPSDTAVTTLPVVPAENNTAAPSPPVVAMIAATLPVQSAELPDPAKASTEQLATLDQRPEHPTILLPADSTVGAAAFRRGDLGLVVLDRRLPLGIPAGLPGAIVSQGAVSTVLQVPLGASQALSMERAPTGWSILVVDDPLPGTLMPQPVPDGVSFTMRRIGRTVTILDPVTGGEVLVGTSLAAGADAAVVAERRAPGFVILPSWLGVAVEPVSDQADLHAGANGFVLRGGSIPENSPAGADVGRRLDLPNEPIPALMNRLSAQVASAAGAPPRARGQARLAAVQAMLALGLGVEAQALAQKAIADDPVAGSDAKLVVADGAAAVLAWRLDDASVLDKPELADNPEADLWRGLRDRRLGRDTATARHLPSHLALARSYPEPLRRLVWSDLAEAAADSGVPLPADQMTSFAAALSLEHSGKINEAIAAFQAVAVGSERRDQVSAAVRATELQLAAGLITPAVAADIMERQTFVWRGDGQELALRLRAAELRAAAGGWRTALDMLRATDALFPDQREAIRARKASVFEAMISADGAGLSPLDVVLLAADYADCVPEDGKDARLARLLAEKLMALDLPARAIPVLQGLVSRTNPGPARAEFGLRLGQLLFDGGDASGAMTALQASDAPALSDAMIESRGLLTAHVLATQGRFSDAALSLAAIHSTAADELRAAVLGQSGDWKGSLDALVDLANKTLPGEGPFSSGDQSLVIREATAAVQAHDAEQLRRIGKLLPRMSGASADMLHTLTEPAITSTSELPRAASELKLARTIPKQIQALASH